METVRTDSITLVDAEDNSASQETRTVDVSAYSAFAVQGVFTGSPDGTFKCQASCDGTNWVDISGASETVSGAGSTLFNFGTVGYEYMKAVWTPGTSSGTVSVHFDGRSV